MRTHWQDPSRSSPCPIMSRLSPVIPVFALDGLKRWDVQDAMQAITAALQAGYSAEELHRLVDEAASQLSLLPSPAISDLQRLPGPVSETSADLVVRSAVA